ncbi:MAG: CHAT domain-containing protein [Roseiflexaceae bacterium]|nr:CHAT domain-containing protein [Roseiflexaceae bacterium]
MLNRYIDFELTFQLNALDQNIFFQAESGAGGEKGGYLPVSFPSEELRGLIAQAHSDNTDEDGLIALGKGLFEALFFQPDVRSLFARTQGAQGEGVGIRLKLRTAAGDTRVAAIPWEFLYDPDRDNPFVLQDISVVRYPQAAVPVPNLEATLPLKVLLSAAQPRDMTATEADRELNAVLASLRERGLDEGVIKASEERHLTRSKFQRLLRQGVQIWHFAGHGGLSRDGKSGVLFFEDTTGGRDAVSARELAVLLGGSGVRLIVLDACESGTLALDAFRSIGPALTAAGVPAVIAMQFKVPEESTTAFAGEFYAALVEGHPIDACVTEGRKAVMGVTGLRRPDWGIPVVYTRAPDGVLFKLPAARVQGSGSGGQAAEGGITINAAGANIGGGIEVNQGNVTVERQAQPSLDSATRAALEQEMKTAKRAYHMLRLKVARGGFSTDVSVLLELEDTVAQVRKLEQDLGLPVDPVVRVD